MSVSSTHSYHGNSEINFILEESAGLTVTIDTDHLHMRSVEPTEPDYSRYVALFGDEKVMEKYATGQTKSKEETQKRINDWVNRWRKNDPYSGFAVFRKETDDFIGHVILGHGDAAGESELAGLFHQRYWHNGYGKESATALVKEYAPATVQEGYLLEGKTLERIVATSRTDNLASCQILKEVGMHVFKEEEKFGALRYHYSINLNKNEEDV